MDYISQYKRKKRNAGNTGTQWLWHESQHSSIHWQLLESHYFCHFDQILLNDSESLKFLTSKYWIALLERGRAFVIIEWLCVWDSKIYRMPQWSYFVINIGEGGKSFSMIYYVKQSSTTSSVFGEKSFSPKM